jgi:uncharacterized iron-regulated protein
VQAGDRLTLVIPTLAFLATAGPIAGPWPKSAAAETSMETDTEACRTVGAWLDPATGGQLPAVLLMESLVKRRIVLLGERHDAVEHHRWQLHTLAGLHAYQPRLVVGFEMFPRAVQPALDAWSTGKSSEVDFLKASRWREVWGYDSGLYMPLLHFGRQRRLPMVALNVDRKLVSRVGEDGWSAIPRDRREGLSDPAPATEAYRRSLAEVYLTKRERGLDEPSQQRGDDRPHAQDLGERPDISTVLESDDFARFVEAQLTWDRAMAEALMAARRDNPDALVVGILGRGHIEHGYGVPHQLADLGEDSVAVLLPVETGAACQGLESGVADAIFLVAPDDSARAAPAKPRLGILIESTDGGIRVLKVFDGSVAELTGLAPGDVILSAATFPVVRTSDLIEIVQRQAPGTWLPLEVRREGETRQLLAKFPSSFE